MKHTPVSSLNPGDIVESVYLIQNIDQRLKKNSEPYFFITLQDSTGTVVAMLWDNYEDILKGDIATDDFLYIQGNVRQFNNQLQITIRTFQKVPESEVDPRAFQAYSQRDLKEMKQEFTDHIASIKNPQIKELIINVFADNKIYNDFCNAPSSIAIHQGFIHGLLEHTLCVVKNCLTLQKNYPKANKDILLAGAILHDIGKIFEYSWVRTFQFTDVGRLLGHIPIGFELVSKQIEKVPEFDPKIRLRILHMILSHHGILEYGSPKRPKTIEALILHYADYIDAYISNFFESADRAAEKGQVWTDYNKLFERYMLTEFIPEA